RRRGIRVRSARRGGQDGPASQAGCAVPPPLAASPATADRPDRRDANDDIVHDVRQVLEELPLANPADVTVTVHHGVVTLTGAIESASQRYRDLIPIALRLASDVDGVVDVVNELS